MSYWPKFRHDYELSPESAFDGFCLELHYCKTAAACNISGSVLANLIQEMAVVSIYAKREFDRESAMDELRCTCMLCCLHSIMNQK